MSLISGNAWPTIGLSSLYYSHARLSFNENHKYRRRRRDPYGIGKRVEHTQIHTESTTTVLQCRAVDVQCREQYTGKRLDNVPSRNEGKLNFPSLFLSLTLVSYISFIYIRREILFFYVFLSCSPSLLLYIYIYIPIALLVCFVDVNYLS